MATSLVFGSAVQGVAGRAGAAAAAADQADLEHVAAGRMGAAADGQRADGRAAATVPVVFRNSRRVVDCILMLLISLR